MSPRSLSTVVVVLLIGIDAFAESGPTPREVRTDQLGDPLPAGAIARVGTSRFGLRGWHQQVFFTSDGSTVIGKGEQGIIRAFDAVTGKVAWEIKDPDLTNWSADQSPDGKLLAVFGLDMRGKPNWDSTLRVYDLSTRNPIWTSVNSEKHHSGDHRVRFTPDGKRIVTAADDVRIWDAKTGDELIRQKVPFGYGSLDISPDGKTIAVGYSQLYLWDWQSGAEPRKVEPAMRCDCLRFSPDGQTVYSLGISSKLKAIDVGTAKPVGRTLDTGKGAAYWIRFSPDGTQYAVGYYRGSKGSDISLRNTKSGDEIAQLSCASDGAADGCWSKDGSRFAAVDSNRVWVWDLKTGKALGTEVPSHKAMIGSVVFSSDGRLFTASDDHTIRAWDPNTGKELMKLTMDAWVRGMDVSRDGSLVVGSALQNDLRVWEAKNGKEMFKLLGHGRIGGLRKARFSADDEVLLTYGDDFYLRAWSTLTGKLKSEHRFLPPNRFGGESDEDDDRMMMAGDRASELGPDGNTFVQVAGKTVRVIAVDTGKERYQFEADPQSVGLLALSPDGKRLATAGPGVDPPMLKPGQLPARPKDFRIVVWDMSEAKAVTSFRVPGSSSSGVLMFTPDGRSIVTSTSDSILRFWNASTGEAIGTVECPDRVGRIAMDSSGNRLAVAFWDATVLVYDLRSALKSPKDH